MAVLVFSSERRKNQKRPLCYEPDFKTYHNCSKLIDAIFREARRVIVQRDKHIAVSNDGSRRPLITKVKYIKP